MKNQALTIIAIVAVVAVVFTAGIVAQDADARHRHNSSRHNTLTQVAITNDEGNAQNNAAQNNGNDVSQIVVGNQPGD